METKFFRPTPVLPSKLSWDYSKKIECNDLVKRWKMMFQASDMKGNQFLNLVDGDNNLLELLYIRKRTVASKLWTFQFPMCESF